MGESIIIAQQTGYALYCDDVSVRISAMNEYRVQSFSTLALMNVLRNKNRLRLVDEAECLAKLVTLNFRHVRFSASHLHDRVLVSLKSLETQKRPITISHLNSDATLGVLLRQFGDREISDLSLIQVAADWWDTLIRDDRIPGYIAAALIGSITYKLSQRTLDNVLEQVAKNRPLHRIAIIWAFFMIRLFNSGKEDELPRVWSALKTAAAEVVRDEKQFEHVLYDLVPIVLYELINKAQYLDDDKKVIALISIPRNFDPGDRERFEAKISRLLIRV